MRSKPITKSPFLNGKSSFARLAETTDVLRYVESRKALDLTAREIIALARSAWMSREFGLCEKAADLVLAIDVSPKLHAVAEYYRCISIPSAASDAEAKRRFLIQAADSCESEYLPRIALVVGKSYHSEGDCGEALRYFNEAGRMAGPNDSLSRAIAVWNIALVEDDCRGALRKFESIFPVVEALSHSYPFLYYDYLNNLAALLNENRRTEESRRAIEIALASPFADRFPEWRETQKEIDARKEPRRSPATVTVVPAPRERTKESPARHIRKPLRTFVIVVVRLNRVGDIAPLRPASVRALASLLERYVKTVRIRDSP